MAYRRRTATLLTATLEAQAAALTTLGLRVPALLNGTAPAAERTRMVIEKAEAMVESAQAVGQVTAELLLRAGTRMPTPAAAFAGWLALTEAASGPFHTRVKANARRLGKAQRKTSGRI